MTATHLYLDAEVDYRLARATAQYPHGHHHHKVRRLTPLRLPKPRRRPLTLA